MAVVAQYRMPHSEFLGWSQPDRDKAIWWHVRDGRTCQSCYTRPEEWDDDEGGDLHAYHAGFGHCRGCEVRAQAQRELDNEPDAFRVGTYAKLIKGDT